MHLGWRGMGLAAAFGWAVGCGGIVVVDSEGAGGSGAAPTGSGMTTAISVTATGQGGGGPQGVCDALCAIGGALGCVLPLSLNDVRVRGSRRRSRTQPNLEDLQFLVFRRTVCSSYPPARLRVPRGGPRMLRAQEK